MLPCCCLLVMLRSTSVRPVVGARVCRYTVLLCSMFSSVFFLGATAGGSVLSFRPSLFHVSARIFALSAGREHYPTGVEPCCRHRVFATFCNLQATHTHTHTPPCLPPTNAARVAGFFFLLFSSVPSLYVT